MNQPLLNTSWALEVTRSSSCTFTGKGVKVAILDSGYCVDHPSFRDKRICSESFVPGETIRDIHGHGTHCAGLVFDTASDKRMTGMAPDAHMHIAKVVNAKGVSSTHYLLAGIEWALEQQCRVILISLGLYADPESTFSAKFEEIAQKALDQNAIIIAPVGNQSNRTLGRIYPVAHPSNCPSVLSVTAVDQNLKLYNHANSDLLKKTDSIDLSAPGVDVLSTWHKADGFKTSSGTSMAAAVTAGLFALYMEAYPKKNARSIIEEVKAQALPLDKKETGAGLIQAPIHS